MNIASAAKSFLGLVAVAAITGWAVHKGQPSGMVLPQDAAQACPPITHGLAYTFAIVLGVSAAVAVVVSIGLFILSHLRLLNNAQQGLRAASQTGLVLAVALGLGMLLRVPIESMFPLQERPPCTAKPGSAGAEPKR